MPLNFDVMRTNMIQGQILPVQLLSTSLRQAVETLPREMNLPEAVKPLAYCDQEILVFENRFMLSPAAFFKLASIAQITSKDAVLDVGCTTGYTSATLSYCAKKVVGIEASSELSDQARLFMEKRNISNAKIITGDPLLGCSEEGPYDVILVEGALENPPESLVQQLCDGGRLVFYRKGSAGELSTAICAHKKGAHLFEEALFHWQASSFEASLESARPLAV